MIGAQQWHGLPARVVRGAVVDRQIARAGFCRVRTRGTEKPPFFGGNGPRCGPYISRLPRFGRQSAIATAATNATSDIVHALNTPNTGKRDCPHTASGSIKGTHRKSPEARRRSRAGAQGNRRRRTRRRLAAKSKAIATHRKIRSTRLSPPIGVWEENRVAGRATLSRKIVGEQRILGGDCRAMSTRHYGNEVEPHKKNRAIFQDRHPRIYVFSRNGKILRSTLRMTAFAGIQRFSFRFSSKQEKGGGSSAVWHLPLIG